uniref:Uncharacterized protein n=1 Tax=Populus alba TaxID=43335 RepID=A0A4U5PZH6_POPAL|nr:hypothetical protein D5086_0000161300 [Populus alba]
MWLTYVRWYCMVALSPDIREFFEAPIVSSSWKTDVSAVSVLMAYPRLRLLSLVFAFGFLPPCLLRRQPQISYTQLGAHAKTLQPDRLAFTVDETSCLSPWPPTNGPAFRVAGPTDSSCRGPLP